MDMNKLESLVISNSNEDRFLAIEFLRNRSKKEIIGILSLHKNEWYRHPKDSYIHPIRTGAVKATEGYLAYNGTIWYLEDNFASTLKDKGYTIVDSI